MSILKFLFMPIQLIGFGIVGFLCILDRILPFVPQISEDGVDEVFQVSGIIGIIQILVGIHILASGKMLGLWIIIGPILALFATMILVMLVFIAAEYLRRQ